jgi:hypothetical protein
MATKPRPSAIDIAEQEMPGWKAVKPSGPIKAFNASARENAADEASDHASKVDAVMPSTKQLREKFFGTADNSAAEADAQPYDSDIELVNMKSGELQRTVGVNVKTRKIEWSQG